MKAPQKEPNKKPLYVPEFPIDKIDLKDETYQSRLDYKPKRLESLAKSIESRGQLYPILLLKTGDKYQLLDGFCRTKGTKEYSENQTLEAKIYEGISKEEAHKIARAANHKRTPLTEEEFAVSVNDSDLLTEEKADILDMNEQDIHHYDYEGKLAGNKAYASYVSVKPKSKKTAFERLGFKTSPRERMLAKARKFNETSHRLSLQAKAFLVYLYYTENFYSYKSKNGDFSYHKQTYTQETQGTTQIDFLKETGQTEHDEGGPNSFFSHSLNTTINNLVLRLLVNRKDYKCFDGHEAKYFYKLTESGKKLVADNLMTWKPLLLANEYFSQLWGKLQYISDNPNDERKEFGDIEYVTEEEAIARITKIIKERKDSHSELKEEIEAIENNKEGIPTKPVSKLSTIGYQIDQLIASHVKTTVEKAGEIYQKHFETRMENLAKKLKVPNDRFSDYTTKLNMIFFFLTVKDKFPDLYQKLTDRFTRHTISLLAAYKILNDAVVKEYGIYHTGLLTNNPKWDWFEEKQKELDYTTEESKILEMLDWYIKGRKKF